MSDTSYGRPYPPIPIGSPFVPRHEWGFSAAEAKAFEVLVREPVATPDMIAPLLPTPAEFIDGISRKVAPYGIWIAISSKPEGWALNDRLGFWHYFPPADLARRRGRK